MKGRQVTSEEFFSTPDVVGEYASFDFLLPPEQAIMAILAPRLPGVRMLDLGVGGGRTTVHFAPRVARYMGVDFSAEMVAACHRRFGASLRGEVSFEVGDARDLSRFPSGSFDFVLFAFQGLDSITQNAERLTTLGEIHRVLAPAGVLAFSSDNLHFLRSLLSIRRALGRLARGPDGLRLSRLARHPRRTLENLAYLARLRRLNRTKGLQRARYGRYVYLRSPYELGGRAGAHSRELIEIDGYAIEPEEQVLQLASAGFDGVRMFASGGEEAEPREKALRQSHWVYYLCSRR